MRLSQLGSYATREIRRRKSRTISNILGYVAAVALIITLVSVTQAGIRRIQYTAANGTHVMAFIPQSLTSGYEAVDSTLVLHPRDLHCYFQ